MVTDRAARGSLRRAGPEDLDVLARMMEAYYAYDGHPFDAALARSALHLLLADDRRGLCWMILADGEPVGYAVLTFGFSLEYHGADAFLDELFMYEQHRGMGLGRMVMTALDAACREHGVRALHLEVERHNEPAQRFYRRLGFEDHDRFLMTRTVS